MGEVRDVANGYARNYLLPRGLAAPASEAVLQQAETLAEVGAEQQRVQDEQAREQVGKLESETLVMAVRVGEQGRLYGSVTSADIAEKAGEILGEETDRRRILLPEVIRSVGLHAVPIRLSRNVTVEVQVAVVDAEAPEGVEAAVQQLLVPPIEEEPVAEDVDTTEARPAVKSSDASTDGVSELGEDPNETTSDAPASVSEDDAATEEVENLS